MDKMIIMSMNMGGMSMSIGGMSIMSMMIEIMMSMMTELMMSMMMVDISQCPSNHLSI